MPGFLCVPGNARFFIDTDFKATALGIERLWNLKSESETRFRLFAIFIRTENGLIQESELIRFQDCVSNCSSEGCNDRRI